MDNMPLDIDQYNVRRTYRDGYLKFMETKTKRNPDTNAVIGRELVEKAPKQRYSVSAITNQDVTQYGSVIQRVSKKVKIPFSLNYNSFDWSKVIVKIENQEYNVAQIDIRYERDLYLYLQDVSERRTNQNG